jgi:hypothetical protein
MIAPFLTVRMRTGLVMDLEPVRTGSENRRTEISLVSRQGRGSFGMARALIWLGIFVIHVSDANVQLCPVKPLSIAVEMHCLRLAL